jgi:hypothetical protein
MKRLKGPELRMPEVKVPPFLADLYYDMRDRRLLPLVALVVVAIAAVPFLLGESEEPLPPDTAAVSPTEEAELGQPDGSTLTVVEAKPGLRDYRKRLRGRTPTDPFEQRYTGLPEAARLTTSETSSVTDVGGGGESGEGSVTVDDTSTSTPPGGSGPGATAPPDDGAGSGKGDQPDSLEGQQLFGFRPDVRFGVAGSGKLSLHDDLRLGSLLPERNAVILFVGVTQNGERALFNVAPGVVVRGDGGCVGGAENCRFLSMRAGDAVDLLTGSPGRSFRLKIVNIDFVELDLPPRSKRASGSSATESRRGLAPGLPQNFSN